MKIVSFKGGLGNQIFQYLFFLYLKNNLNNKIYGYYNKKWLSGHNGLEIENIFDVKLPKDTFFSNILVLVIRLFNKFVKSKSLYSNDDELDFKSIYFDGWWQDMIFYEKNDSLIQFKKMNISYENSQILKHINCSDSVSIHIRRGDYLEEKNYKKYGNICNLNYYEKAISLIKKNLENPHFFIFSDDIEWAKNNLKLINVTFVTNNKDNESFIDMFLMTKCKANIIANSSFSYWGAYLNKENKKVIYPKKWDNSKQYPPNIFKANWTGI
jgi:hypothetical protein